MEIIVVILVGIVVLEYLFIMIFEMFFIDLKVVKCVFKLLKYLEGD